MAPLRIANYIQDSIVDGPGLRFTLFVQGCPHLCEGCHNPETHDFAGGTEADTQELIKKILANPLTDGVTFSGGEPMAQAGPLCEIARAVREKNLNIWTYTGYTIEQLLSGDAGEDAKELLYLTDVLVDGRFELPKRTLNLPFRGSSNQRLIDVPATLSGGEIVLWKPRKF